MQKGLVLNKDLFFFINSIPMGNWKAKAIDSLVDSCNGQSLEANSKERLFQIALFTYNKDRVEQI